MNDAADTSEPRLSAPPYDLSLDIVDRAGLLERTVDSADWLDATLLAAGMNQVASDRLEPDPLHLGAAVHQVLARRDTLLQFGLHTVRLVSDLGRLRPSRRRIAAWRDRLEKLERLLAAATAQPERADAPAIRAALDDVRAGIDALPADVRGRSARLPACFHAFDLDVPDVETLAARFAERHPDRDTPLLVAGVRTSGSYLAPLLAAFLGLLGFSTVETTTIRPRRNVARRERKAIRRHARRGGLVLLLDDPPGTGGAVAEAARDLERIGAPRESIVLLLPLFGPADSLPARLSVYESVVLPADEWIVATKLSPGAIRTSFATLLPPGTDVGTVELRPLPYERRIRSHRHAVYHVELTDAGGTRAVDLLVQGIGLGYFSEHALALSRALAEFVPVVYGIHAGCLYRAWLPEHDRAVPDGAEPSDAVVEHVSRYIAARRSLLSVERDRSGEMFGENPAWESASRMLGSPFGRFSPAARVVFLDRLSQRLLHAGRPSIVDGATSLRNWFATDHLVKVNFATHSFSNTGYRTYDATYDLAGATVTARSGTTAAKLRAAYETRIGEPVDDETLLLYELVHQNSATARGGVEALDALRTQSRSVHRYLARTYVSDVAAENDGDVCAIDLDGVFETGAFGFLSTSATGAIAVRALLAHGVRPVVVTGRSTGEIRDRCRAYGLQGGVSEYGAVLYLTDTDETVDLLGDADRETLARVRSVLAGFPEVELDDAYRHVVRAFVEAGGRRRPLPKHIVDAVLTSSPDGVRQVEGWGQTDFVSAGIDKGSGVTELLARIGGELALAVGDTRSDLPMLRLARLALAPANADTSVREAGIEVVGAPHQTGLSLAVARLIGHEPGRCDLCRVPDVSEKAALVARVLAFQERTGLARVRAAARFAVAQRARAR